MGSFDDFIKTDAEAEGPEAVAELEAFRLHFSLARQLAARRRERHLTQKQLAALSGIDQAEISRIERGQANPTTSTLGALTHALDVERATRGTLIAAAAAGMRSVPRRRGWPGLDHMRLDTAGASRPC